MPPYGPQLIGEAGKAVDALLKKTLAGTGLSGDQWVTMLIAARTDGDLLAAVEGALLPDPTGLIASLEARALLANGGLSDDGRDLAATVRARLAELTGPLWTDLSPDDVAATERTLNTLITRAHARLAD